MRLLFASMLAGVLLIAPAATSSAGEIRRAAQEVGAEFSRRDVCAGQSRVSVGIWPFDEASIPLSPTSAYRLYAKFLGALMEVGPDCIDFFDGDGTGATISYLGVVCGRGRNPTLGHRLINRIQIRAAASFTIAR